MTSTVCGQEEMADLCLKIRRTPSSKHIAFHFEKNLLGNHGTNSHLMKQTKLKAIARKLLFFLIKVNFTKPSPAIDRKNNLGGRGGKRFFKIAKWSAGRPFSSGCFSLRKSQEIVKCNCCTFFNLSHSLLNVLKYILVIVCDSATMPKWNWIFKSAPEDNVTLRHCGSILMLPCNIEKIRIFSYVLKGSVH